MNELERLLGHPLGGSATALLDASTEPETQLAPIAAAEANGFPILFVWRGWFNNPSKRSGSTKRMLGLVDDLTQAIPREGVEMLLQMPTSDLDIALRAEAFKKGPLPALRKTPAVSLVRTPYTEHSLVRRTDLLVRSFALAKYAQQASRLSFANAVGLPRSAITALSGTDALGLFAKRGEYLVLQRPKSPYQLAPKIAANTAVALFTDGVSTVPGAVADSALSSRFHAYLTGKIGHHELEASYGARIDALTRGGANMAVILADLEDVQSIDEITRLQSHLQLAAKPSSQFRYIGKGACKYVHAEAKRLEERGKYTPLSRTSLDAFASPFEQEITTLLQSHPFNSLSGDGQALLFLALDRGYDKAQEILDMYERGASRDNTLARPQDCRRQLKERQFLLKAVADKTSAFDAIRGARSPYLRQRLMLFDELAEQYRVRRD